MNSVARKPNWLCGFEIFCYFHFCLLCNCLIIKKSKCTVSYWRSICCLARACMYKFVITLVSEERVCNLWGIEKLNIDSYRWVALMRLHWTSYLWWQRWLSTYACEHQHLHKERPHLRSDNFHLSFCGCSVLVIPHLVTGLLFQVHLPKSTLGCVGCSFLVIELSDQNMKIYCVTTIGLLLSSKAIWSGWVRLRVPFWVCNIAGCCQPTMHSVVSYFFTLNQQ